MDFFTSLLNSMPGAAAQGLIWGIMAIGVYITYRILDVADLTVDGSLATGGAVCVVLTRSGLPEWRAVLDAGLAGRLASAASVVVAAVAGVAGVMMAQALGRGDRQEAQRGFFLNLAVALALAGALALACALWPEGVMRLYTDDARTVAEAAALDDRLLAAAG